MAIWPMTRSWSGSRQRWPEPDASEMERDVPPGAPFCLLGLERAEIDLEFHIRHARAQKLDLLAFEEGVNAVEFLAERAHGEGGLLEPLHGRVPMGGQRDSVAGLRLAGDGGAGIALCLDPFKDRLKDEREGDVGIGVGPGSAVLQSGTTKNPANI